MTASPLRQPTDGLMAATTPPLPVYVLEFAGEDDALASREARSVATTVDRIAPGLATAWDLDTDRVSGLALTRHASRLIGRTDATIATARELLAATDIDRTGTVAVRARDVRGTTGVDTQAVERTLGDTLIDRGLVVDLENPENELRALFADGVCVLGWLVAESVRDFGDRKPTDKPFFQPGSMDPLLARTLVNIAGAGPGRTILDPMCGTGGLLVEAGLVGARVVGMDVQRKMVRGTYRNLDHYRLPESAAVIRGDVTRLPIGTDTVDGVVFDAPYGRQSKIVGDLASLLDGALAEARRVAPRAVVVADRPWSAVARDAGWTVVSTYERRTHRSLTRHIMVLEAGADA